ncbi:MAG: right-handed parallel beta-helix repeat-containing protein [Candidatus Hermodarchaeota archaeon]
MKPKKTDKTSIFIILFFCSLVSTNLYLINNMNINFENSPQKSIEKFDKLKQSNQWTLPNIYITNWSMANSTYDWCNYKDGYYIIENVSITGVGGINGIHIENTTENFIIRNCQINEGVQLMRTESGELVNNTIYFGYYFYGGLSDEIGIAMNNCSNIIVRDNHLNDTYDETYHEIHGFLIYNCNNITIEENSLSLQDASDLRASQGLSVQETQGNNNIEIVNNTIYRFELGIYFDSNVSGCNLMQNQIYNSRIGLVIYGNNHVILNNIVKNCTQWSVFLGGSNNKLFGNKISEAESGIRTSNANYNHIDSNTIQDVSEHGMHFIDCKYNNITNNNIQRAGEVGIYLDTCNHTIINGNFLTYNLLCIVEIDCYGNIIENNTCIQIPTIIGYYPALFIGILLMTTLLIIRFKFRKSEQIK